MVESDFGDWPPTGDCAMLLAVDWFVALVGIGVLVPLWMLLLLLILLLLLL